MPGPYCSEACCDRPSRKSARSVPVSPRRAEARVEPVKTSDASRVAVGPAVEHLAPEVDAPAQGVPLVHPRHRVAERQRLRLARRRRDVAQAGERRERDRRDAPVERIGRHARDARVAGDVRHVGVRVGRLRLVQVVAAAERVDDAPGGEREADRDVPSGLRVEWPESVGNDPVWLLSDRCQWTETFRFAAPPPPPPPPRPPPPPPPPRAPPPRPPCRCAPNVRTNRKLMSSAVVVFVVE